MEDASAPVGIESLLRHREWVRRIARALVRDENLADDLEQEVWVDALERPPRRGGSIRAWFATALRNNLIDFRRSEGSRRVREKGRSRPEAETPTPDLVAEAEAHGRLVAAVMALPEPGRSTMLLHYFHGLTIEETARRQGVPPETVRTRVRRGLAALRERFDRESGGDRGAWMAALLPLAPGTVGKGGSAGAGFSAAEWGGLLVQTSTKVAVAAAIVATGGAVWWALSAADPAGTTTAAGTTRGAPAAATRGSAGTTDAGSPSGPADRIAGGVPGGGSVESKGLGEPAPIDRAPAVASAPATAPPCEFTGRILLAADRAAVEGATVTLRPAAPEGGAPREPLTASTVPDGAFSVRNVPAGTYEIGVAAPGYARQTIPGVVIGAGAGAGTFEVLLAPGGAVRGTVLDERNEGVAGIPVIAKRSGERPEQLGTRTGESGEYRIDSLAFGLWNLEAVRGPGRVQRIVVNIGEGDPATADFRSGPAIVGTVADAEGRPLAGAIVYARPSKPAPRVTSRQSTADREGAFVLGDLDPGDWAVSVQVLGDRGFAVEVATVTVESWPVPVVLRLESGEIAGRVTLLASGQPHLGAQITLYRLVLDERGQWVPSLSTASAFLDAEGRYAFRGLKEGRYRLAIYPRNEGLRRHEQEIDLGPGERKEGVDVALVEMRIGTVRISLRDPAGKAVEGATFSTVTRTASGGWSSLSLRVTAKEPGVYLATLGAGTHTVSARREDLGSASLAVEVKEGGTVEVEAVLRKPEAPK